MSFGARISASLGPALVRRWAEGYRLGFPRPACLSLPPAFSFGRRLMLLYFGHVGDGLREPDIEFVADGLCGGGEFGGCCHAPTAHMADKHPFPHAGVPRDALFFDVGDQYAPGRIDGTAGKCLSEFGCV